MTRSQTLLGAVALLDLLGASRSARAQDAFEIQVYRPELNRPGQFGLELHSIYDAIGRNTATHPEVPTEGVLRETFEPSLGLTRWWELGAYLQFARVPDRWPEFAGIKLRSKFRVLTPASFPLRFGVNVELSYVTARFEANRWGAELRPIVAWHPGRFDLSFNPILSFELSGTFAGVPHFEPCLAALYEIANVIGVGIEYYAAFGPVTQPSPWSQQGQYLFLVANVIAWRRWEINPGIGFGLTDDSNPLTIKVLLGHEF